VGQTAKLLLTPCRDRSFEGKVKTISPTASMDFHRGMADPPKLFRGAELVRADPRMTPGMGAQVRVAVARVPDGL